MDGIFISYRRDDSAGYAGRLYDRLIPHFGTERVFMDVEGIELGADFVTAIEQAVGSCRVLVVIIGDEWLTIADAAGRRRLDDPHDFIRLETATALRRGIRVVPVLVGGALMPRTEDLPPDLQPLARRQAIEISHKQWEATTDELIHALDTMLSGGARAAESALERHTGAPRNTPLTLAESGAGSPARRALRMAPLAGLAVAAVVGAGWFWMGSGQNAPADADAARSTDKPLLTAAAPATATPAAAPPTVVAPAPRPPETVVAAAAPAHPAAATAARPSALAGRAPPARAPMEAAAPPVAAAPPPVAPAPVIRLFQAQPDPSGARLCYSVTNAEQLTLLPRPGELGPVATVMKDCVAVELTEPTTFTLRARNAVDTVSRSITVARRTEAAAVPEAARPADAGTAPRVGESWTYRTSGKWPTSPRRSIVMAVQAVANDVVTEGLKAEGLGDAVGRSSGARPMFTTWSHIGNEFSPYLGAYKDLASLGTLKGFATPDVPPNWGQWYSEARVVGQETVTVPAGSFQAHKVEVWSSRHATEGPLQAGIEPVRIHYLVWYAAPVKRYVKMQRRVLTASGMEAERDVFELVARR